MTTAPLELVMITFPGRQFSGGHPAGAPGRSSIAARSASSTPSSSPRVTTDDRSSSRSRATTTISRRLRDIVGDVNGLIAEEDIHDLAEGLAPGDSAGIILFEHTWASDFADAVKSANGEVLVSLRIPPDVVDEVVAAQADDG